MRLLFWLLGLSVLFVLPARAGQSPPKILMRIYVQTPGNGQADTQTRPIAIPPDNETIFIRSLPEITEQDLTDVRTDPSGYVHFFFNHKATVDLDVVTGQDQGRILVVTIDGEIVYAPIIDEQLSTGELIIPHPLPAQVIGLLQDAARHNVAEAQRT